MHSDYDIAIVGGGMVGLALAKLLADTDLSITVIDNNSAPNFQQPDRLRVSAISRASQHLLSNMGCWNESLLTHACAYDSMHVWDDTGGGEISFHAAELGEPDIGHIIPNADIIATLWRSLEAHDNIHILAPVALAKAEWHEGAVQLTTADGHAINAKLAVAADGANSWLRQQSTLSSHQRDYNHHAVVATVQTELSHNRCARQNFLESGPLALLPLNNPHQCSIVWSTSPNNATALVELDEHAFNRELEAAFGTSLGGLSVQTKRLSFPLIGRHVDRYIRDGLVLVGDAAHTIHPLAGQGVNLGFLDVATLAQIIKQSMYKGLLYQTEKSLRPYERWRRSENQLMLDGMSAIKSLFAKQPKPFVTLRSLGMDCLDKLPFAKRQLTRIAMGLDGDLPKLARAPKPDI